MLEISNTAWAFAQLAERNSTLMEAIAASAIAPGTDGGLVADTPEILTPNGIYSIAWSSWRAMRPDLGMWLFRQDPHTSSKEPLVCGVLIMDAEWLRCRPSERGLQDLLQGRGRSPSVP
mmetsp:Transcript_7618/g.23331  ORF Transcript_7618/g.23331 Transcript_7618/m.23331 type:complete len:119 (+) Transcript_7618:162-518(+)